MFSTKCVIGSIPFEQDDSHIVTDMVVEEEDIC